MPVTVYNVFYQVFIPATGEFEPKGDKQALPPLTSVEITGLDAGFRYQITIEAVNEVGASERTEALVVNTLPATEATVPAAPTNVRIADILQTQAQLSWVAPSSNGAQIYNYALQVTDIATLKEVIHIHDSGVSNQVVIGLNPTTRYSIRVAAINAVGQGGYSRALPFETIANAEPDMPQAPIVKMVEDNLQVSWTAPWDGNLPITAY